MWWLKMRNVYPGFSMGIRPSIAKHNLSFCNGPPVTPPPLPDTKKHEYLLVPLLNSPVRYKIVQN